MLNAASYLLTPSRGLAVSSDLVTFTGPGSSKFAAAAVRITFPNLSVVQMNSQCRVLIVSRDETLLKTRELLFGAYFRVTGVGRVTEAVAQLALTYFDLVVLCHSLRSDECERIAKLAHDHAHPAKILALRPMSDFGEDRAWADDEIGVDAGPYGLLLRAAQILDFRILSRAKSRSGIGLIAKLQDPKSSPHQVVAAGRRRHLSE